MEYITLENTDLRVSRFCMGGCPLGGYGWGNVRDDELVASVGRALECGVNFFDTADTYGLGHSELMLAKGLGAHRKDVVIQSKSASAPVMAEHITIILPRTSARRSKRASNASGQTT